MKEVLFQPNLRKMREGDIRILPGGKLELQMSPYELNEAWITSRRKQAGHVALEHSAFQRDFSSPQT